MMFRFVPSVFSKRIQDIYDIFIATYFYLHHTSVLDLVSRIFSCTRLSGAKLLFQGYRNQLISFLDLHRGFLITYSDVEEEQVIFRGTFFPFRLKVAISEAEFQVRLPIDMNFLLVVFP